MIKTIPLILACAAGLLAADPAAPGRIVSIAPSITEEIFLLGAADRLVGDTTWCVYPEAAKKKTKVGNILDLNLEVIASLKPDLVIGTTINEQSKTGRLSSLGITARLIPEGRDFREMCSNFIVLGGLIGLETRARSLVAGYRERLAKVSVRSVKPASVLFVVGTEPLIVAGRGSYITEIIGHAGGRNAVDDPRPYLRYSLESVVAGRPDIVVFSSPAGAADKEIRAWKRRMDFEAVRKNRVFTVDPDLFGLAVPSRFVRAVETLKPLVDSKHN